MGIGEDIVKAELNFIDGWSDGHYGREPTDRSNEQYMDGYSRGKVARWEYVTDERDEVERFQIIPILKESQNPFCPIFEVEVTTEGQASIYISNDDDGHYGYTVQVKATPADIGALVSFANTLDQVTRDECKSPSEWYSRGVKDGLIRQSNPPTQSGKQKLAYLDGYRDGQHNEEAQS